MKLFKENFGWTEGLKVLTFHGQELGPDVHLRITSAFEIAACYPNTRFAQEKLMFGYIAGVTLRILAGYSEGYYLLTAKGAERQSAQLRLRGLSPRDVWLLTP